MPTVSLLNHYYISFNAHFYRNHYIEINQLFKPYGVTYKDPYFNFASKYKPEQVRKYLFNIFHNANVNKLPKDFTWMIKLYNLIIHQNLKSNITVFQIFTNGQTDPIVTYRSAESVNVNKLKQVAYNWYQQLPTGVYLQGAGLIPWLSYSQFAKNHRIKQLIRQTNNLEIHRLDYLDRLDTLVEIAKTKYNINVINIHDTKLDKHYIISYYRGEYKPSEYQEGLTRCLGHTVANAANHQLTNAINFEIDNQPEIAVIQTVNQLLKLMQLNSDIKFIYYGRQTDWSDGWFDFQDFD